MEENGVLETCRDLDIAFVAYAPLGRGFLTGKIPSREALDTDDWRRSNPRFSDKAMAENVRFVASVKDVATQKGATPAQVALAWVLAQGEDIFTYFDGIAEHPGVKAAQPGSSNPTIDFVLHTGFEFALWIIV